jgi:isonocardicin synthase
MARTPPAEAQPAGSPAESLAPRPEEAPAAAILFEPFERKPYDLFFVQLQGRRFVGRKTPFRFRRRGRDQELKCALVDASMVLGPVIREQLTEAGIAVYYQPLEERARRRCFAALRSRLDHDLYYPFPHLTAGTRREKCAPEAYWNTSPERVESLGAAEEVLREYTLQVLARLDLAGAVLYDPACSTGEFLSAIQRRHPSARTIGQDKSREMVDYCRGRLDEVHWGDSRSSPVPDGSVDFIFCRFLNADVVTTAEAHQLFVPIARRCRDGGHLLVLGHTPVLLSSAWFEALGLEVLQRIGYSAPDDAVFQYYVLRKTGRLREPAASAMLEAMTLAPG